MQYFFEEKAEINSELPLVKDLRQQILNLCAERDTLNKMLNSLKIENQSFVKKVDKFCITGFFLEKD